MKWDKKSRYRKVSKNIQNYFWETLQNKSSQSNYSVLFFIKAIIIVMNIWFFSRCMMAACSRRSCSLWTWSLTHSIRSRSLSLSASRSFPLSSFYILRSLLRSPIFNFPLEYWADKYIIIDESDDVLVFLTVSNKSVILFQCFVSLD